MRDKLGQYEGKELTFIARAERFGEDKWANPVRRRRWLLLEDVRVADTSQLLADHVWVLVGDWTRYIIKGDTFVFSAEVVLYEGQNKADFGLGRLNVMESTPRVIH